MFDLTAIDTELSRLGLGSVKQVSQLGGGDTTGGYHLACDQGDVFMKSGPASYQDMFDADPHNPFARLFLVLVLAAAGRRDAAQDLAAAAPSSTVISAPSLPVRNPSGPFEICPET